MADSKIPILLPPTWCTEGISLQIHLELASTHKHPRPTESEIPEVGPRSPCLKSLPDYSDACCNFENHCPNPSSLFFQLSLSTRSHHS